eukprot:scaffold20914_cov135-Isochrysis_galbana.AAC.3
MWNHSLATWTWAPDAPAATPVEPLKEMFTPLKTRIDINQHHCQSTVSGHQRSTAALEKG